MAKDYYMAPHRRVGPGRGAPNKLHDDDLRRFLLYGPATVVEIADRFGLSRSAAYYRLRAMETEGQLTRTRGPGRFDYWERADGWNLAGDDRS